MIAKLATLTHVGELDELLPGPLIPENRVKWACYKALQANPNGIVEIYVSTDPPVSSARESRRNSMFCPAEERTKCDVFRRAVSSFFRGNKP